MLHEWTNEWKYGWIKLNGWMYSIKEKMYKLIYRQMNKWVDGLIDGWMNRLWLDMKQQIDG